MVEKNNQKWCIKDENTNLEWDIFRLKIQDTKNSNKGKCFKLSLQILKLLTFGILFFLTLFSAVIARSTFLLMISGISTANRNISICNEKIFESPFNEAHVLSQHAAKWVWGTFFAMCVPELLCFIWCLHRAIFRNITSPTFYQFIFVTLIETVHAYGLGTMVFDILPNISTFSAIIIGNNLFMIPLLLNVLNRRKEYYKLFIFFDVLAIAIQIVMFWLWPLTEPNISSKKLSIYCSTISISIAWWQNFLNEDAYFVYFQKIAKFAIEISKTSYKTYLFVTFWKCLIYFYCMLIFIKPQIPMKYLFGKNLFEEQLITITACNLTQNQVVSFQERMQNYEIES